jgi:hypothetical protein
VKHVSVHNSTSRVVFVSEPYPGAGHDELPISKEVAYFEMKSQNHIKIVHSSIIPSETGSNRSGDRTPGTSVG